MSKLKSSRFSATPESIYYIKTFREKYPKISKTSIGKCYGIQLHQVNICLRRDFDFLPEEKKEELNTKIDEDYKQLNLTKYKRVKQRKFTREQLDNAFRIKAKYEVEGKKITWKKLSELSEISLTRVGHFYRSKSDIQRYNQILEEVKKEIKNVPTFDALCEEVTEKLENKELWSDLEPLERYFNQRKLDEKALGFILRKKVENITAAEVGKIIRKKGYSVTTNTIRAVWRGDANIYPAELKRMKIPVPVYEYLVSQYSPYVRWGIPKADDIIRWWRENEFTIKQYHEKAKTICQEHKKFCCKECNFSYYRVRILTHRINSLLRLKKLSKKKRTIEYLCLTADEFIKWIEDKLRSFFGQK